MSAKILSTENSVVTLELAIPADKITAALNQSYNRNRNYFTIPGFRKGKAPRKVIESHYGKGIFLEEAIDLVFPDAYKAALAELEIEAMTRPSLENVEKCDEEEGAIFVVKVAINPEVKLGEYKGATIEPLEVKITDEDIAARLKEMASKNARIMQEDDNPAAENDIVVIDYEGFIDDVAFEGGKDTGSRLELGSHTFIPGFEEQLIGTKAGDHVEVKVTFPIDYHAPQLAGKDAVFQVDVKEHFRKVIPRIDDDFAKDVSEFDTILELNADIKKKLQEEKTRQRRSAAEFKVVDFAVEHAELEIPDMMIEEEAERSYDSMARQMQSNGLTMDDYLKYTGSTPADFRASMKPEAEKNIRAELVLNAISKAENIEATDEQFETEIKSYAEALKKDVEEYKKEIADDTRYTDYIKANIVRKNTIDFLIAAAIQE